MSMLLCLKCFIIKSSGIPRRYWTRHNSWCLHLLKQLQAHALDFISSVQHCLVLISYISTLRSNRLITDSVTSVSAMQGWKEVRRRRRRLMLNVYADLVSKRDSHGPPGRPRGCCNRLGVSSAHCLQVLNPPHGLDSNPA